MVPFEGSRNGTTVVVVVAKYSGAETEKKEKRQAGQRTRRCHHLVVIPVPEEVNRSVSPALDDSPATIVYILFTPDLHWPLCFVWSDQVHAAGAVTGFLRLKTVSEWTWRGKRGKNNKRSRQVVITCHVKSDTVLCVWTVLKGSYAGLVSMPGPFRVICYLKYH